MAGAKHPGLSEPERVSVAVGHMEAFAADTGLTHATSPRRYLWTDAFAVCNCLTLHGRTADRRWLDLATLLVDRVHHVLGQHRPDDSRSGWLSGLGPKEGEQRPTAGGLRIGKPLAERKPSEATDAREEWDRDGQYYHYLTRWMHALERMSLATGEVRYHEAAIELARVAHRAFVYRDVSGQRRMVWKMSIDLTRPLVESMGQHDALDGLVTLSTLRGSGSELRAEIAELVILCQDGTWATDDPLGLGGLLVDASRVVQLGPDCPGLGVDFLTRLLDDAVVGLAAFLEHPTLVAPVGHRLAFRELGLAIGLEALGRLAEEGGTRSAWGSAFPGRAVQALARYLPLAKEIEATWREESAQQAPTWLDHLDINRVMLATSLVPDEYLRVGGR